MKLNKPLAHFSILLLFIQSVCLASNTSISIENEFIKAVVNNHDAKGRFALETTLGNPELEKDNFQSLIYGKPIPWTSYTTLLINDLPFIFGNSDKRLKKRSKSTFKHIPISNQLITKNKLVSHAKHPDVAITQTLSFYKNPNTNVHDSILIKYTIKNISKTTQNVGLRILLDTKLGSNDGAPLFMGENAIKNEIKLNQADMYDYWQAFDSLSNPTVIAQGLLKNTEETLTPPDAIHLANWGSLVDHPWNSPYEKGRSFIRSGENEKDTALAMYFNPIALPTNTSKTFSTVYGLGGITISAGKLSLGISAPKELPSTEDKAFLIVAYILNSGGFDAYNVNLAFSLPRELEIVKGNPEQSLNIIKNGEHVQVPLLVKLNSGKRQKLSLSFRIESDTFPTNTITHLIHIKQPPKIILKSKSTLQHNPKSPYILLDSYIQNPSKHPINNLTMSIEGLKAQQFPPYETKSKHISTLEPYSQQNITWQIQTSMHDQATSFTLSARSPYAKNAAQTITIKPAPTLQPTLSHYKTSPAPSNYITLKLSPLPKTPHPFTVSYPKQATFLYHSTANPNHVNISHSKSKLTISTTKPLSHIYLHFYSDSQNLDGFQLQLPKKDDIVRQTKKKE